jgi:hypothetical protein
MLGLAGAGSAVVDLSTDMVSTEAETKGGDPMRRRTLLGGGAALAAGAALTGHGKATVAAFANDGVVVDNLSGLLFDSAVHANRPVTYDQLATLISTAAADFRAVRYAQLTRRLPPLVAIAIATREATPPDQRCAVETLVAEGYGLATELLIKLHQNGASWATADRAVQAATASGDPRILARAQRVAAIVLRRSQHHGQAQRLLTRTAQRYAADTGLGTSSAVSLYASLLATAAYTAALKDDAATATGLADEAADVMRRGTNGFAPNELTLYRVGINRALGDYGQAIDYARQVRLDLLVTPERRARYWEDTALALHGRGRLTDAYHAMRQAERAAPQEVRFRPWAQQLTRTLVAADSRRSLQGLHDFAARIGVTS